MSSVVTPNTYKIGVDGGGTKTELILVDAAGEIVARHLARGCNPSQTGTETARKILTDALAALLAVSKITSTSHLPSSISLLPAPISHTALYMAGSPPFWAEVAASLTGFGQVTSAADSVPVLELATSGAPGIVLHAGTGSFVIIRSPEGNIHYTGGLGWKFGDPGSGFDLGRRAIALALLDLQANPPLSSDARPSPLAEALVSHTGLMDYAANSRYFYTDPAANATIASFAPRVLALAVEECGPAQQVVADSVTELARLADGVIHKYFPNATKLPCGVSGKILNSVAGDFALRSLANKLNWPVELNFITTPPIEGVRRLLLKS